MIAVVGIESSQNKLNVSGVTCQRCSVSSVLLLYDFCPDFALERSCHSRDYISITLHFPTSCFDVAVIACQYAVTRLAAQQMLSLALEKVDRAEEAFVTAWDDVFELVFWRASHMYSGGRLVVPCCFRLFVRPSSVSHTCANRNANNQPDASHI